MAAFQHKLRRYKKSVKFTIIKENQSITAKAKPAAKKPKKAAPNYIENEECLEKYPGEEYIGVYIGGGGGFSGLVRRKR